MTASEAIEWLKGIEKKYIHGGDEFFDNARKIAISTAISALEKQIPKKPIVDPANLCDFQNFLCPKCNKKIISRVDGEWIAGSLQNYCDDCGQKLLWESDTE